MLTTKQVAEMLNGREYRQEMTPAELKEITKSNLVVIFGASDDIMVMAGALTRGGKPGFEESYSSAYFNERGLTEYSNYKVDFNFDDCGYTFTYTTNIEHETFDIMEDGDTYCRGIVFSLDSMEPDFDEIEDLLFSSPSALERYREMREVLYNTLEFLGREYGPIKALSGRNPEDEIIQRIIKVLEQ